MNSYAEDLSGGDDDFFSSGTQHALPYSAEGMVSSKVQNVASPVDDNQYLRDKTNVPSNERYSGSRKILHQESGSNVSLATSTQGSGSHALEPRDDDSPWIRIPHRERVYGNEIERYVKVNKLGEGTYGAVYQCRDRNTGETVALKRMRVLEDIEEGISASTIREISILYELSHPNVVTLHDVIFCESQLCLVFEFLDMDLKRYMKGFQLSLYVVKSIVFQILSGLAHCHSQRILHRDVKPHNILISPSSLNVKIADFGLARAICTNSACYTQEVVTQWYRAPEILLGVSDYSPSVDVWSTGCIMGELLGGGNPLFPGDCEIDQIFKIFQMLGTPSHEDWGDFERCKYFSKHFPVWSG
eukprot:CAMPEP_0201537540 /NCGR_PEP_ID=MMETSP0161_2-20130828/65054_1 /ASSEMBLY_ACC=CAM_ASM_000251 /TAXON_ID=180227 /ORGANISM="Neoparamoeba aestuarina, Strain SoJaBio B1-5/56/2" /LENGTH=357 /DNA_ID=CAMNT_0047943875 /DNA_START=25 /DNA_END=1095 /DNA_ORIENTATION=-